jgi:hypothetical protein
MTLSLYLASCGEEQSSVRNDLASVLMRAGINVIPEGDISSLSRANCSVHIHAPL